MRVASERPAKPDGGSRARLHRVRKGTHVVCFLVFVCLPFVDLLRFDIPRQRFYFAGQELWINELAIVFFALMFLMALIGAAAMIYGRIYCSFLCPQMIFSEAAVSLERWLGSLVRRRAQRLGPKARDRAATALFYALMVPASIFLAFVFIAYFVEPADLWSRLLSLDVVTAGGIAGAATTLLTFMDFAFVRLRFCTTVCPYGYLQAMLADRGTLLVRYSEETGQCIECKKCVRVCPMDIDIRRSPHQIECVHCGECIDACDEVLERLGREGLIRYSWGDRDVSPVGTTAKWYHRLGFRDAKRFAIVLVLVFYASGLAIALTMRHPVLVRLSPDRSTLYTLTDAGEVLNRYRVTIANRGRHDTRVTIAIDGLDRAHLVIQDNPIVVRAGEMIQRDFQIARHAGPADAPVIHFAFSTRSAPDGDAMSFPMTFITPSERGPM